MKKTRKRVVCVLLAMVMLATSMLVPDMQVSAATAPKKVRIHANQVWTDAMSITLDKGDYKIANLKSNSKNLIVRTTYVSSSSSSTWNSAQIRMYAKKTGTYKVKFDVVDHSNKVKSSHTVKVYAKNDYPIKKITFGGKSNFYTVTTKTKGKFKVTMNKGYKLNSIQMTTYNKAGKSTTKKIKNGQTVTLGKYRYIGDKNKSSGYENWYASFLASTTFTVNYTDKYTKEEKTTTYSIYRLPSN